ncbi:MAG: hypothetical protein AAF770_00735 [Bacteroidota bacterium]
MLRKLLQILTYLLVASSFSWVGLVSFAKRNERFRYKRHYYKRKDPYLASVSTRQPIVYEQKNQEQVKNHDAINGQLQSQLKVTQSTSIWPSAPFSYFFKKAFGIVLGTMLAVIFLVVVAHVSWEAYARIIREDRSYSDVFEMVNEMLVKKMLGGHRDEN